MPKEAPLILRICDWVTRYSVYATIFLMPILFLPWTSDVLDFNKQTVLILLGFVGLFAWMLRVLVAGKFEIRMSKMHIVVGVSFLIYLLATVFSVNKYGSFWGWPQITAESLLSLIGLVIFYFLVSTIFTKKDVITSVVVFSISALIAQIIGLVQLFGVFLPFSFAKSVSFNTIGSIGALGLFGAMLLPLTIIMLIISKKWWKVLFGAQILLSAFVFFVVGYTVVWWAVLAGSIILIIFGVLKRNLFDGRWMALPMFFLAVAVFFILLNPQIPLISQKANEIFLSQNASFNISIKAIKERPFFGSGPGTFAYDFLKFKDPSFSQSSLWSVTFSQAGSKFLNDLSSEGVVGLIALLALMGLPIFYGVKFLIFDKMPKAEEGQKEAAINYWILTLGVFAVLTTETVAYFLYNANITLLFFNFFMIACLVALTYQDKDEYKLKPSSLLTLGVTFVFTLLFIFGIGILVLDGQRYVAEINYVNGLNAFQAKDVNLGAKNLESAASLNSNADFYFVQLSQVYLGTLQNELAKTTTTPSSDEKTKIQNLIANSVNAAKMATNLNPSNSSDWANLGYVYQSLNGIIGDTSSWALGAYQTAVNLDPNNPYLLTQQGSVNFVSAEALGGDKADQKNQLLSTAQSQLERAVQLNQNYSNGLYYLGLVYDAEGQKDNAIKTFTKLQQLNPKDGGISKVLSNLNAGLPALQQASPVKTTPPPSATTTPTPTPTSKATKK